MSAIIQFNKVSKSFTGKSIISDFSFSIEPGDKVRIAGNSGIGKSSLLKLILCFEKPDLGEIYFDDIRIDESTCWQVRKKIAYVSQDLNIGNVLVKDLFLETVNYQSNKHLIESYLQKTYEYLSYFELNENILDKNIETLSGGEKQRIAIINALLLDRNIFLLDEISSALDNHLKEKTMSYFLNNKDFTVLYISHDSPNSDLNHQKTICL